jgi:hypothetical protein
LFKIPDNAKIGLDKAEIKQWNDTEPDQELAETERKIFLNTDPA